MKKKTDNKSKKSKSGVAAVITLAALFCLSIIGVLASSAYKNTLLKWFSSDTITKINWISFALMFISIAGLAFTLRRVLRRDAMTVYSLPVSAKVVRADLDDKAAADHDDTKRESGYFVYKVGGKKYRTPIYGEAYVAKHEDKKVTIRVDPDHPKKVYVP